jgi:hypothetical protein
MRLRATRLTAIANAVSRLPGTFYDFTGSSLPAPWDTLRRAGLGTRVDAAGAVGYGAHNLLRWSEDISNAVWPGFSGWSATSATQVTASGGGATTRQTISAGTTAGVVYTLSLTVQKLSGAITQLSADIGDGTPQAIVLPATETRLSVTLTAGASGAFLDFVTNGAGSFTITALQLTVGSATPYVPTTTAPVYLPRPTHNPSTLAALGLLIEGQATQLLGRTEDFSNAAAWGRTGLNVSANAVAAPDGTSNAETLTGTSTTNCVIFENSGISLSAGQTTWSVFLKRGTADFAVVSLWSGAGTNGVNAWINLQTKQLSASAATAGYSFTACLIDILPNDWIRVCLTGSVPAATCFVSVRMVDASGGFVYTNTVGKTLHIWGGQPETGTVATSYIPNPTTGTAVRTGDFAGGGITGAALTALLTPTAPFTLSFQFRKGNNLASVETLLGLCAGASAGTTNQLGIATNGTQAQIVHSSGSGSLTGTLVLDGSTVNRIAVSVDPANARASISVNGSTPVETTGIAYTGAGTTALIPGARDSSGGQPATAFTSPGIRVVPGQYITGAALQALSA